MTYIKCSACGGKCEFQYGKGYVCDSCGNEYDGVEIEEDIADKLNFANEKRINNYDFEGALQLCREILRKDPDNQGANWCALLAEYQIVYLQNDEGKYKPTFLNPKTSLPISESGYYAKLNSQYRRMADEAEEMRREIVKESKKIHDYDVFISYRRHIGKGGKETAEAEWANEIYSLLDKQNLRVFFDKKTLGKSNAGWEPHIYVALRSAKVMILFGSSLDNINSNWVKNEWKRFAAYRKMGQDKTIAVVGSNFDPTKLPDVALREKQMIDVDEEGWQKKLLGRVSEACSSARDVNYLLTEAEIFIQKKKFELAKENYRKVCEIDPRNSLAYWGLLRCKLKAFDDYEIVKSRKQLVSHREFNEALRYAQTDEERRHYEKVCDAQLTHDAKEFARPNYLAWRKNSKVSRFFKKTAVFCMLLVLCGFGVYSYLGISQPISYGIENGKATASGKSIYFNFLVKELEINTYQENPVVKIGDGAFKGGNMRSVKLGKSIEELGNNAFSDCKSLESVTIENATVKIGDRAFSNCSKLKDLYIGAENALGTGLYIGAGAFSNCRSLESVTLTNCTYIGAEAFRGCSDLLVVTLDLNDETTIGAGAFDGLKAGARIVLPSVAEEVKTALQNEYPSYVFETYTREAVEECEYFIGKLQSVSANSETLIERAEQMYEALDAAQKAQISNYGVLQNARIAFNVVNAIEKIGQVTLDSGTLIGEAENLYATLNAEQKTIVSNSETLWSARAIFNVMSLIGNLEDVTIASEQKIAQAEEAYLALTYEERDCVLNYAQLTSARVKVDRLLADAVMEKIDAIGSVITSSDDAVIAVAESAYHALSDTQKALVSNYAALTDARAVCNVIKAIEAVGTVTSESGSDISVAEALYDDLSTAQKMKVTNYGDLTDSRAAFGVVRLIAEIGTVIEDSNSAIENAETAYARLNKAQRQKVSNHAVLTDSRAAYSVVAKIEKIKTVTLDSETIIEDAQNSYNSLTSTQQNLVGNRENLTNAKKVFDVLKEIDDLGDISLSSSSAIAKAESDYNRLTTSQQALVTNRETLTMARAIYNLMTIVDSSGSLSLGKGDAYNYVTLSSSNMVSVLNNASTRGAIDSVTLTGLVSFSNVNQWIEVFKKLSIVRYDVTSGVSVSSFAFTPSNLQYRIIGATGTQKVSFSATSGDELNLVFDNFSMISVGVGLDVSKVGQTNLTFVGSCGIISEGGGTNAVSAKNLQISLAGGSNTTIAGGTGGTGMKGGNGISAKSLVIYSEASEASIFTVYGGDGGTGRAGEDSTYVPNKAGNGKDAVNGTNGNAGNKGGDGGAAISVDTLQISAPEVVKMTFYGGAGGEGGSGGKGGIGGEGGDVGLGVSIGNTHPGGKGGTGGIGGLGGTGGYAVFANVSINVLEGNCTLKGGDGGKGGTGGTGGKGGKSGANGWTGWTSSGDGGTGGKGGDGGTGRDACNKSFSTGSMTITKSKGKQGAGGTGGSGGAGAAGDRIGATGAKGENGSGS